MKSEEQMLLHQQTGYVEWDIKLKDTRSTEGLSEGVESRTPRDLPRRYICHHKADLQDEFIQL